MATGAEIIRQVKERIKEVDPREVRDRLAGSPHGASVNGGGPGERPVVVDVREQHEFEEGHIPGAVHVPRGHLESRIEGAAPDRSQPVVLYCASGNRSALAADTLERLLGYENVESMTGG
ncbi:MAG TPA: rhodanese-like domain-containing protein, partial [Thermoleophilaceae bacterium]|nr:rhodanese-like domain-containing protein [Thermoleophilaceae bacterium]